MTNAELFAKIRAEIERMIEESDFDESANLYSLLSFLSSLEEKSEKPINLDLEKDAVMYCFDKGINLSPKDASEFARHFAEWGAEHLKK